METDHKTGTFALLELGVATTNGGWLAAPKPKPGGGAPAVPEFTKTGNQPTIGYRGTAYHVIIVIKNDRE